MTDITIRLARRDDVPAIIALLADDVLGAAREEATGPLPDAYWRAFDDLLGQGGNHLVVAERAGAAPGKIVGCLQLDDYPRPITPRHEARADRGGQGKR